MELNTIFPDGLWGKSADRINRNFERVGSEVDKMKYAAYNSKLYATEELLRQELPSPKVGEWAIVGPSIPGEIYRCDEDGVWSATGETGGGYGMEVTEMHVEQNVYTGDFTNAADNEDLVSELDEEGKEVLKLADKPYDAATFSGMGRVYLRKNLTGGKNVLAQEMMSEPNTRYIIQYDYDLNGATLTVPEGCTLDFQGGSIKNGHMVLQRSMIEANGVPFSECSVTGSVRNGRIDVTWFGADGRGMIDSAGAIRTAIAVAYNSYQDTGDVYNKRCSTIYFPMGKYKVSQPLIDSGDPYEYGSFNFVGEGQVASIITYDGNAGTFLFNNDNIFAYTNFQDLGFHGNNVSSFMRVYSNVSKAISQSITFDRVRFGSFRHVIVAEGDAMCSELNFVNCKVVYFDQDSVLFVMDNLQAVNWRFFGTEIEQTYGVVFRLLQGTYISMYSSSIIPFGGTFIEVPVESQANSFWLTNTPQIQLYACRFELREKSVLIRNHTYAYTSFLFIGSSMGGSNITPDENIYQIVINPVHPNNPGTSNCKIYFQNCSNFLNYRIYCTSGQSAYKSPSEIHFDRCDVNVPTILESSSIDKPNNSEGILKVYENDVLYPVSSLCPYRKGQESVSYLLKSSTNYTFCILNAGGETNFGSILKVGLYVGAINFNIKPSQDITLYLYNTEATYIYGKFTIKAWTNFCQTVKVGKLITKDSGVNIMVTNLSSTSSCQIDGVAEVVQTIPAYHVLLNKALLSDLDQVSKGLAVYDSKSGKIGYFDGVKFIGSDGYSMYKNCGTRADRPTINANTDVGYCYFETDYGKPVWWTGTNWVDANGSVV